MPYKDPEKAREHARVRCLKWAHKDPARTKAIRKKHYDKYREKHCAKSRAWYWANRERALKTLRRRMLMRLYGLTEEQYVALGTTCAICGATEDGRQKASTKKPFRLAVDHDHDTRRIRGLLCGHCNCGIGYFKHDTALMAKAIEYLQKG